MVFQQIAQIPRRGNSSKGCLANAHCEDVTRTNTQPSEIAPFRRDAAPVKVLFWSSLLMLLTIIWSVSDF